MDDKVELVHDLLTYNIDYIHKVIVDNNEIDIENDMDHPHNIIFKETETNKDIINIKYTINFMNVARATSNNNKSFSIFYLLWDFLMDSSIEDSDKYINEVLDLIISKELLYVVKNDWFILDFPDDKIIFTIIASNDINKFMSIFINEGLKHLT